MALSPLSPIVLPFALVVFVRSLHGYLAGRDELTPSWITRGALGLWIAMTLVWLARFAGYFDGPVDVHSIWR